LAHVDAGKTTLSEAILYHTHSIKALGRVDHQDAYMDGHPLEKQRGITIFSDQAMFDIGEKHFTLVDTPGHIDFAAEMERSCAVLDYAILVVSCVEGIQAHTETIWKILRQSHVPTFLFLNKTDRVGANVNKVMEDLKCRFSPDCVLSQELDEAAAERDEHLLDAYLDGKATKAQLQAAAASLIRQEQLFPCFTGAALQDTGVTELLDALHDLTITKYDENKPLGAYVYRIRHDENGSRLAFVKLMSGKIRGKDTFTRGEQSYRVNELRLYSGNKYKPVQEAVAGQLVALTGLPDHRIGDLIGECEKPFAPLNVPLLSAKVNYPKELSPQTALAAFKKLDVEDPMLGVNWVESLQELHINVMGTIQLEVLSALVQERFGFSVTFDKPEILYRETVLEPVRGAGHYEPLRHYAEVHVEISPMPRGSGITFESVCHVDKLLQPFQNLVRTHVFEKEHKGVLVGAPLDDVSITLLAGRMHLKHTEGGDFRQATYRAIRQGLMKAKSRLLEPFYAFSITAPQENLGRILADIVEKGGSFDQPLTENETVTVTGRGSVARFMDYATELTVFTKGKGHMSLRFDGYEPCRNEQEVIARIGYNPEADKENDADSVFCAKGAGFAVHWDKADEWMHCNVEEYRK